MSAPKHQLAKCMITDKSGRTLETKVSVFIQRKYKKTWIIIGYSLSLSVGKNAI